MEPKEIKICVREANPDDRGKILEFKKSYPFNHVDDYFPGLKSKIRNILFGRDCKLFICEIKGEVVGCVGSIKNSLHNNLYYVDDFFILPQFRGLHIGKKLCARGYELRDGGKKTKFHTRVEASNLRSRKVFEGLGNRPFQFNIFYSVYKSNSEPERKYGLKDLSFGFLIRRTTDHLYSIFKEIVGGEYFDFFEKTNRCNFLFPNQNYREIIALLIRRIFGVIKYRILLVTDRNEIVGYALNFANQNQIYLAPSVVNNQSILNCNQALYDFLKPSDSIENYYHIRKEAISSLTYSKETTRNIEIYCKTTNNSPWRKKLG
jgi:hypothetical protein